MELFAVITTLLSVYLTIKLRVLSWPVGIIGVISYFVIFYQQHLYGQAVLQSIFLIQSFYGWFHWNKTLDKPPSFISVKELIFGLVITNILILILRFYFLTYTDNASPTLDSITTALSLLGIWYTIKKIIYAWVIWFITDLFFIMMFLDQELYWSALLYIILIFLVIKGFFEWIKIKRKNEN